MQEWRLQLTTKDNSINSDSLKKAALKISYSNYYMRLTKKGKYSGGSDITGYSGKFSFDSIKCELKLKESMQSGDDPGIPELITNKGAHPAKFFKIIFLDKDFLILHDTSGKNILTYISKRKKMEWIGCKTEKLTGTWKLIRTLSEGGRIDYKDSLEKTAFDSVQVTLSLNLGSDGKYAFETKNKSGTTGTYLNDEGNCVLKLHVDGKSSKEIVYHINYIDEKYLLMTREGLKFSFRYFFVKA